MERLKPGEYQKMTDEQKKAHRAKRYKAWVSKPENKKKVSEFNRNYQKSLTLRIHTKVCRICGEFATMSGRQTICYNCKHLSTKSLEKQKIREKRNQEKNNLASKIIFLATTTTMLQREIAEELGTYQEYVSHVLRKNGFRRGAYTKRKRK